MSKLAEWLQQACSALGLHAEPDFRLILKDRTELRTIARIADLGAPNGMLVIASGEKIFQCSDEVLEVGYGWSVLDEPWSDEQFDLESFQEMFVDWGWSAPADRKPGWMP